jgi:two-component system chemotaxis response regulator CheB
MAENKIKEAEKLIIIGGSSGGIEAMFLILEKLKSTFSIPIVLVLHRSQNIDNSLTEIFNYKTNLVVKEADEKDELKVRHLYIAPPNYHLLIESDGSLSLDVSEKVLFSRPSIDVSFESAARAYGPNLTAVLLSGANMDGSKGLQKVKLLGGEIFIQDPKEAAVNFMPQKAIDITQTKNIFTCEEIAKKLNEL